MKITHLIFSFATGGAQTMLVDIVNEQINLAEVSIVIINNTYNEALINEIDKRVQLYFINRIESSKNPYYIIKLNFLLLRIGSDILHCHDHNIVPWLLTSLKGKAILTVHDTGINTTYFNRYKKIFAISKIVKKDILSRSGYHARLVYNGICINKISQKESKNINSLFKIVVVSRLHHEKKGQHLVLESLHILKEKGIRNIQLDFIGSGSSEQYLKELSKKYGLSRQVTFLGMNDRCYIYSHLKDYDLLIQPSIWEGFGLTVTEAMIAKIPVLVSNIDGPTEIIEDGKYGYIFQSGNVNDLSNKLIEIINNYNSKAMNWMVESAYLHVCENFDINLTVQNYLDQYST